MSGPDLTGLPEYFRDNPWVEILANRGQEDQASMGPVKVPGASEPPARSIVTAPEAQPGPPSQPSQAPSGQEFQQLIGVLAKLVQGQVAQANAQGQPMVMVIPIVIQVPYPWPVQAQGYEIGGCGGVLRTPRPNSEYANCALLSPRSRVQVPAGPPTVR